MIKKIIIFILIILLGIICAKGFSFGKENLLSETNKEITEDVQVAGSGEVTVTAKSAILMEASTGTVLFDKDGNEKLSPASITKIMTLILIFDNLEQGKIKLEDMVTTSAYAKSMGGSQVFLEEGEQQSVETLIKCIVVASGNDASVAMAEYIAGSEEAFVAQMNERAKNLGMENTHFEDCCGLTESDNHYTTAMDVARMSRELITKYPQITKYSTIWMENITHVTDKGSSEFCLSNTNKLLKQYPGTTGLKTGSTSKAKYCLSATANRNNVDLIAVIMAAPDYKARFSEAQLLLNYGFAICDVYRDENKDELENAKVTGGVKDNVSCTYKGEFSYLTVKEENVSDIKKSIEYKNVKAPVKNGSVVGYAVYTLNDKEVGRVEIIATENIKKAGFIDYFKRIFSRVWIS